MARQVLKVKGYDSEKIKSLFKETNAILLCCGFMRFIKYL